MQTRIYLCSEAVRAMLELHKTHKMAHCKVNLQNMVLADSYTVSLIGLDHLAPIDGISNEASANLLGYQSPESIDLSEEPYSLKEADLLALGVCLFSIYNMLPPFEKASPDDP